MDWETYNVDLDESQPADTDVSFGDLPASDAEREADGKTLKRKKRRETPDSKGSSEFSGSPVVSSFRLIWNIAVTVFHVCHDSVSLRADSGLAVRKEA